MFEPSHRCGNAHVTYAAKSRWTESHCQRWRWGRWWGKSTIIVWLLILRREKYVQFISGLRWKLRWELSFITPDETFIIPQSFSYTIRTLHLSSRLENKHGWASNRKHFQQLNWPAYWTLVYSSADYNRYFQYNFVIASPGIWPNQIWRVTEAGTLRGRNIKSNGANGIWTPPVLLEENTVTSSILKSVV